MRASVVTQWVARAASFPLMHPAGSRELTSFPWVE
jgi:hypothetical protein